MDYSKWKTFVHEDVDPSSISLDSFQVQSKLNSEFWSENKLNPFIRERLIKIAEDFWADLDLDMDFDDITFTGSLANYNWSQYSDIDLHIIIDYAKVDQNVDLVREMFMAKKSVWNQRHDIFIHDFEVEIYVQDGGEEHVSTGVYSVLDDKWLTEPEPLEFSIDKPAVQKKAAGIMDEIDKIENMVASGDTEQAKSYADKLKTKIRKMRQCGLEREGAYSNENLAFKVLRRMEYLGRLSDLQASAYDRTMGVQQ
jgi:mRNA-degrading endonuclease YafQ of YafQ-DinJ toxin-antitoxin module